MTFEDAVEKLKGMHTEKARCLEYSYWVRGYSEPKGQCRIYVQGKVNAYGTTWEQAFLEAYRQTYTDTSLSQAPQGEPEVET